MTSFLETVDGPIQFGALDVPPIPADFFFPGSDPFIGPVRFSSDGNGVADCVDDCPGGADTFVSANKYTVGSRSNPGSTKEPLVGIQVCAYDKSDGSCARRQDLQGDGISHQEDEAIAANCAPVNCCTTDLNGECTIHLPPGDYIVISVDTTETVLPDPLGVSASDLLCGELKRKHLQQIVKADGK